MRELLDPQLPPETFAAEMILPIRRALLDALRSLEPTLAERDAVLCIQSFVAQLSNVFHLQRFAQSVAAGVHPATPAEHVRHIVAFTAAGIQAAASAREAPGRLLKRRCDDPDSPLPDQRPIRRAPAATAELAGRRRSPPARGLRQRGRPPPPPGRRPRAAEPVPPRGAGARRRRRRAAAPAIPERLLAPGATLTLAEIVDIALQNNPATRASYFQARAAAAQLGSQAGVRTTRRST